MMHFDVRALSADHRIERLRVEAADEAAARAQVAGRGLQVASLKPVTRAQGAAGVPTLRLGSRATAFSVPLFSQELLALLRAGLSLVEALETLIEKDADAPASATLKRLLDGLREGKRFSAVLAEQGAVFSALYVGMVRTAEGTSDLPRALERYIEYEQRLSLVRAKVVSASIYPAILLGVGGVVSLFLIGYVVPRFAEVYQGTGRSLPWLSQRMLDWGEFAGAHGPQVLFGVAVLVGLAVWGVRSMLRKQGVAGLLALLPGVDAKVRLFELSRLYLALGMLAEGGIAIVPALRTAASTVSPRLGSALEASRGLVEQGIPLSEAFAAQGLTTPVSLRMLRVGERTGDMGALLNQAASFYDGEISRWIDRFTRSFEPLLMAGIGLVVGVIVVMLYMPIFDLAGNF